MGAATTIGQEELDSMLEKSGFVQNLTTMSQYNQVSQMNVEVNKHLNQFDVCQKCDISNTLDDLLETCDSNQGTDSICYSIIEDISKGLVSSNNRSEIANIQYDAASDKGTWTMKGNMLVTGKIT